jgi:HSP90 family molecular chaperone
MRFLKGVVDSEDLPLNISRETMQDSALLKRLRAVLTRRILRFFDTEARRDAERYNTRFFPEFGQFLKEGAVTDGAFAGDLAKLLRFESSGAPAGAITVCCSPLKRCTCCAAACEGVSTRHHRAWKGGR